MNWDRLARATGIAVFVFAVCGTILGCATWLLSNHPIIFVLGVAALLFVLMFAAIYDALE